ncbi:hypothetical protein [uncultured Thiodictyon sp.]|uniref:hypothetical protein n=1 Tax=uncultured Thiodictyon sp. TaxID=1846217 RepID=UPI0025EB0937|nr:hypothetical protein [uncultured Thiodictyon sp.]
MNSNTPDNESNGAEPVPPATTGGSIAGASLISTRQATVASAVFGAVIAVLTVLMTVQPYDSKLFSIEFLLIVVFASLMVTLWIGRLISSESAAALKAQYGSVTIDVAGTFGVFLLTGAGLFFGFTWLQERWWVTVEVQDPQTLKRIIDQHKILFKDINSDDQDLDRIRTVIRRFSDEERLHNRIVGQYCYYVSVAKDGDYGWFFGRLSIQAPASGPPVVKLSGRVASMSFESGLFVVDNDGIFYDWTVDSNPDQPNRGQPFGMASLKFKASTNDDSNNILEMSGNYARFGDTGGAIRLIRNQPGTTEAKNFCAEEAARRDMKATATEQLRPHSQ